MAIRNNYDVDVAIFYNTKDVELKGICYVYTSLSVLGTTTFGNAISLSTPSQGGGILRIIADVDGDEPSIGYYNYNDSRAAAAGELWGTGIKCWNRRDYNLGTPMLNSCLNINDTGAVTAYDKIRTPLIQADTIRENGSAFITVDADVHMIGFFNSNKPWNRITGYIYIYIYVYIYINDLPTS